MNTSTESLPQELSPYALDSNLSDYTLELGYEHFSAEEVLRTLLPQNIVVPTGFETVGHIAHLNLKDEQMPYRHLIGEVILDKTHVQTVVTKLDSIQNTYRTFDMEVIAGEPKFDVTVKEVNAIFKFNFKDVYWCSKLQNERTQMLKMFQPGDILCDMFAGVGPLSVRAAKMGCRVIANDLNPACYKALLQNALSNKVANKINAYNLDAREFMRNFLKTPRDKLETQDLLNSPPFEILPARFHKAYMNLPMDALEFLDVFVGNFNPEIWNEENLPMIYVYSFAPDEGYTEIILERLHSVLGDFEDSIIHIRHVRSVSPHKEMYCVEFRMPAHIAFTDHITKKLKPI